MLEKSCRRLMAVLSRTKRRKMSELRYSFCEAFPSIEETKIRASQISRKPHA